MNQKTIPIMMPEHEGSKSTIEKWLKQKGDNVSIHEPLVEISTDKVTIEISSPATGILENILKQENQAVTPDDVLGEISPFGEPTIRISSQNNPLHKMIDLSDSLKQSFENVTAQKEVISATKRLLSPAVRKLMRKHGIVASEVTGTGKGGRITYKDVESFVLDQKHKMSTRRVHLKNNIQDLSTLSPETTTTVKNQSTFVPHNHMRRQIANHMVESVTKSPHVTAIFEANMAKVIEHRNQHKETFQKQGVKLTFTSYFTQAVSIALQKIPEINSRWHNDKLEIFHNHNIGIATALENGLVVPVLHEVQNLNLMGIANKLQSITMSTRKGNLTSKDVQGGTFTITNHGVSGSLIATPIINQPQSAILGIGKLQKRVVVVEVNGQDSIQIQPMIYVTLTIDHRALDGFQANKFLSAFVDTIENWSL